MCEVLDRIEKKGIAEGMAQGMAQGIERGMEKGALQKARETALNLNKMGLTDEMIAKAVNVNLDLVRQWLGIVMN